MCIYSSEFTFNAFTFLFLSLFHTYLLVTHSFPHPLMFNWHTQADKADNLTQARLIWGNFGKWGNSETFLAAILSGYTYVLSNTAFKCSCLLQELLLAKCLGTLSFSVG